MELISTDDFFILQPLQKGESNIWVSKKTAHFEVRPSWDLATQDNPECLGMVWALVGKLNIHRDLIPRMVVVKQCERIGELPGRNFEKHGIYKVQSIATIPICEGASAVANLGLKPCPKHKPKTDSPQVTSPTKPQDVNEPGETTTDSIVPVGPKTLAKLGGSLKIIASDAVKSAGNAAARASQVKVPFTAKSGNSPTVFRSPNISRSLERFERRILEEFSKLFNWSESFYFSFSGDLTNSLQRQTDLDEDVANLALWRRVDDRFFFNKHLIQELIDLKDTRVDPFIVPFIQGYVEMQFLPIPQDDFYTPQASQEIDVKSGRDLPDTYMLAIVSRRSRHRAGTRYKRRGVDEQGKVANFVETEQLLVYHHYTLSFLMVRGSVPVHWSQPGYKYRPPPRLDASVDDDRRDFQAHFDETFKTYGLPVCCVSLVEKIGRESVIAEAFLDRALAYDSADLKLVMFDFHEYCRGMRFENVDILMKALEEDIRNMRYCWMDRHGVVCKQRGVFRVNCIDCLDRTNVVQTAIARIMLQSQLTKLGVMMPDTPFQNEAKIAFQGLWANNGDVISRQYAGTNALKGDFTRTGERNISGLMKDGVNSASRYYLNQFRDAFRQASIDIMTGNPISEEIMIDLEPEQLAKEEEPDSAAMAEQVRALLDDCKKLLISDQDSVVGAWGLINNDPVSGDIRQEDMDVIFILTKNSYYAAEYEDTIGQITQYQKVLLSNIDKIEFGLPESSFNLGFNRSQTKNEHSMRIFYRMPSDEENAPDSGYFHMYRSTNLRFFNNMAVIAKTEEEKIESLKCITDSIGLTMELGGLLPDMWFGKLERKKSKTPIILSKSKLLSTGEEPLKQMTRGAMFLNMTSQISKLNPISRLKLASRRSAPPEDSEKDEAKSSSQTDLTNLVTSDDDGKHLSPMPKHVRRLSKSSEDLNVPDFGLDVVSPEGIVTAMTESIGIREIEAAADTNSLLTTTENVLGPFAKITKGFQNFGSSSNQSINNTDNEASARSNFEIDTYKTKVLEAKSNTKVVLL